MATKVAIQYGVLTGKRVGKRFRKALEGAGYENVDAVAEADMLVAHSAGCFWLPDANIPTLLINPPYWPGKSIKQRTKERAHAHRQFRKNGYSFRYWLARTWWGAYYAFADFSRHRQIARHAEIYSLPDVMKDRKVIIVRNSEDEWLTPDLHALHRQYPQLEVIEVAGDHDNCWYYPEPYIAALKKLG